jgi:hypothetical protein
MQAVLRKCHGTEIIIQAKCEQKDQSLPNVRRTEFIGMIFRCNSWTNESTLSNAVKTHLA